MKQFDHSQPMEDMKTIAEAQTITQQRVSQPAAHIVIGSIKDVLNNKIIISYERNLMPQIQPALATVEISQADISRQVALLFTEQGQPIVMGFITPPVSMVNPEVKPEVKPANTMEFDVVKNGEHCTLQASKSITLQCGDSYFSMNSQGEITINGENITTKARKKNNIIGGTVNLN